jgi:hypothetical protein
MPGLWWEMQREESVAEEVDAERWWRGFWCATTCVKAGDRGCDEVSDCDRGGKIEL